MKLLCNSLTGNILRLMSIKKIIRCCNGSVLQTVSATNPLTSSHQMTPLFFYWVRCHLPLLQGGFMVGSIC
eukprot:jgi/Botrbrau1/12298/Bobra.27_5s0009.1